MIAQIVVLFCAKMMRKERKILQKLHKGFANGNPIIFFWEKILGLRKSASLKQSNIFHSLNLKLCTFRTFSVLLASDMTWAAAGASRPLKG